MNVNKTVFFFTQDTGISFVQNEIKKLSLVFETVVVCAFQHKIDISFPHNVKVINVDYKNYSTSTIFFKNFFLFTHLSIDEFFSTRKYFFHPQKYFSVLSELLRSIYLSDWLKQQQVDFNKNKNLLYSFWFNQWTTALAILVKQKQIENFVSRAHGTDLFEERVPVTGKLPFRTFQLNYVSKVFSVSKKGELYLKNKYPKHSDKIFTSYLGTQIYDMNPFDSENVFTIVSCAKIRNIKRIHLLAEIVSEMNFLLKWIHIGDENIGSKDATIPIYLRNKERMLANKNVQFKATGNLSNEQVFELYEKTSINLFVSVSETEGLPVSMMEAISFGIPILSTDVGGCNEIVTDKTGILIPKDFDAKNVSEIITNFKNSKKNTTEFRQGVRKFWEENFDGEKNFKEFLLSAT